MNGIRVSATDLDQLRYYRENDWLSFDELLARLRRQQPATAWMDAGTAWHAYLEKQPWTAETWIDGRLERVEIDEHRFEIMVDADIALPPVREVKTTRIYEIAGAEVTLVGKADGLCGPQVIDHKLSKKAEPDAYDTSLQWRVYLELFGAERMTYHLWKAKPSRRGPRTIEIVGHAAVDQWRYEGIGADVEQALRDWVAFSREHLPERWMGLSPDALRLYYEACRTDGAEIHSDWWHLAEEVQAAGLGRLGSGRPGRAWRELLPVLIGACEWCGERGKLVGGLCLPCYVDDLDGRDLERR